MKARTKLVKNNATGRMVMMWDPTPDQVDLVKKKWATYHSPDTLSKQRLLDIFKIQVKQFDRWAIKNKVKPRNRVKGKIRDFSQYQRVPVPCALNCPTYILVPPGKDPEEAKKRYMQKMARSQARKGAVNV